MSLALAAACLSSGMPRGSVAAAPDAAVYSRLPLTFEANRGQTDRRVKLLAHGPGYLLFLTRREAVISLAPSSAPASRPPAVVRMTFVDPDPATRLAGRDKLAARTNYFVGNDPRRWVAGVPNYAAAEYRGLYPGVDALFHGRRQRLEFDFVLRPGADPRDIVLRLHGIERMSLDRSGNLVLRPAGARELVLGKPHVFQRTAAGRRDVRGRFVIRPHHELAFALGPYDASRALTIDPTLSYSSLLEGGTVAGLAVDASGKVYVVGSTYQGGIPVFPDPGAYQTACAACATNTYAQGAAFIAKLDTSQSGGASLIYATYLGPTAQAIANPFGATGTAIAVDSSGDAFVTGTVTGSAGSSSFPTTPGAFLTVMPGNTNAFVAELDPTGEKLLLSTYLGGNNSGGAGDSGTGIALDTASNVYVTGLTGSPNLATQGAAQTALPGPDTPFVAKLDPSLSQLTYFTYLGGGSDLAEAADAIAVDAAGEAYVVGSTESSAFPTPANAGFQAAPGTTAQSGFLAKLNPTGTQLAYLTYIGGNPNSGIAVTAATAVTLDSSGDAYVTGTAEDGLPTPGSVVGPAGSACVTANSSTSCPGGFVAEINPAASGTPSLLWLTYLGGLGPAGATGTAASGIARDASGNIFVTGLTGNTDFPLPGISPTAGGTQLSSTLPCLQLIPECWSAFLVELSPGATQILYSTYLGGAGGTAGFATDGATAIAIDSAGNIDLAGKTTASDGFPVTSNAYDATGQSFGTQSFVATITGVASGQGGASAFASYTLNGMPPQLGGLGYVFDVSAPATTSVAVPIVLTNTGGAAMTISDVELVGSESPPWTPGGLTCQGVAVALPIESAVTLPPGESCTINLQFAPTMAQTGQDEELEIFDSATATNANSPISNSTTGQYLILGGTGTAAPPPPFASYSVNGTTLTQPNAFVPVTTLTADLGSSASAELLLTNTGGLPFTVSNVQMSTATSPSPWTVTGGTCPSSASGSQSPISLAPQESCTIDVLFAPTSSTPPQDGALAVADTATGSSLAETGGTGQVFLLQGIVGVPYAGYSTRQVKFGNVAVNQPESETLTVLNTGTGPLDISKLTIAVSPRAPQTLSDWSLVSDCNTQAGGKPYPLTIAPGASCGFTFQLDPAAPANALVALVSFLDDASQSNLTSTQQTNGSYVQQVQLYGVGVLPPSGYQYSLDYSSASVSFSSASGIQTEPLTVTNTGSQPVEIVDQIGIRGWFGFTLPVNGCTAGNGSFLIMPVTLASGEQCTFTFQYDPSVSGAAGGMPDLGGPYATVEFIDNADMSNLGTIFSTTGASQWVTLLGPGAVLPAPTCGVTGGIDVSAGGMEPLTNGSYAQTIAVSGANGSNLPFPTYLTLEGANPELMTVSSSGATESGTVPTDPARIPSCANDVPGSPVISLATHKLVVGPGGAWAYYPVQSGSVTVTFAAGSPQPEYQSIKASGP